MIGREGTGIRRMAASCSCTLMQTTAHEALRLGCVRSRASRNPRVLHAIYMYVVCEHLQHYHVLSLHVSNSYTCTPLTPFTSGHGQPCLPPLTPFNGNIKLHLMSGQASISYHNGTPCTALWGKYNMEGGLGPGAQHAPY